MTYEPDEAVDVLRAVWAAEGSRQDLDEACGPATTCRNMKDVTFDGMAEPGSDLTEAWRERLRREGKLRGSGGSIRELVFGDAREPNSQLGGDAREPNSQLGGDAREPNSQLSGPTEAQ